MEGTSQSEKKDSKFMKSVIYTGVGEYSYADNVKEIPVPQKHQVLIRVECVPINPSDLY
jgi:NADPH:quinone reductase-like Zn-dependent oxidoreductase